MSTLAEKVAAAITDSGILGCGCCATTPTPTCACGKELWELDYETCTTCGETPLGYQDRADALAAIVLNAFGDHAALVADLSAAEAEWRDAWSSVALDDNEAPVLRQVALAWLSARAIVRALLDRHAPEEDA